MRLDKRYGAFLILSIVFLAVFLLSSPRYAVHSKAAHGGAASASGPSAFREDASGKASLENKGSAPVPGAKGVLPVFPVDINTAGVDDLMLLPGIGEKTAQRIVEKRKELGKFKSVDELTEVKWIGPAKLARIRDLVTVKGSRKDADVSAAR
jgi:competence protein ComEA